MKATVVIEFKETGGGEIWPVEGRSGVIYGYAIRCPKRGTFCLRMALEQFRKCREDIFHGKKISYPPIPDIEIEDDVIPAEVPTQASENIDFHTDAPTHASDTIDTPPAQPVKKPARTARKK